MTFALCLQVSAQTLSVRDIMQEPSLAGMRPESEKLSPDGKLVAFSWNAEGREPRNLYLISTDGSDLQMIVSAEKNYEPRTQTPASKLNYGLTVRDDFTRTREKNLGGAEFSERPGIGLCPFWQIRSRRFSFCNATRGRV